MRTTLTLDADIADRLREEVTLGRRSFEAIVNAALRIGLGIEQVASSTTFRVIPHSSAFLPGIDPEKLNQVVAELDAAEFVRKHSGI